MVSKRLVKFTMSLVLFLVTMLGCKNRFESQKQEDWPRYRGPNANGINNVSAINRKAIKDGLNLAWEMNIGDGYSSPVIKGEYLYITGHDKRKDTIYCLDVETGKVVWQHSYPAVRGAYPGPYSTPTIDENRIYSLSKYGLLFCLDASTGEIIWEKALIAEYNLPIPFYGLSTAPIIKGDMLILNVLKYGLALDKNDGSLIWKSPHDYCGYASPVFFTYQEQELALFHGKEELFCVDYKTGTLIWSYKWKNRYDVNAPDPIVYGDKIFVTGALEGGVLQLIDNKPELLWKKKELRSDYPNFVLHKGYLYGSYANSVTHKGKILCAEFDTGRIMWEVEDSLTSVLLVKNTLVFQTDYGELILAGLNSDKFEQLYRTKLPRGGSYATAPVFLRNKLFVRNNVKGYLYCFDFN